MPRMRARRLIFWASAILIALTCIEAGAAATTAVLVSRGWMAEIPRISPAEIEQYLAVRDEQLGWGHPRRETQPLPCVSVYGDSFTTADADGFPAQLGRLLNCPVESYGVGGYGSDQAALLAEIQTSTGTDSSQLHILAHVSENILRNVNQYRNLLYPRQELFFKPRFVLDGDRLVSIPPPVNTADDFRRLQDHPEQVLTADAFLARPRRTFPFTVSLLRWLATDFHVRATITGVPRHQAFYSPSHPSGAFQTTLAILTTFARKAGNRVVVLIPVGDDFAVAMRGENWPDQPLALALRAAHVRVIHAGPLLLQQLPSADPCALFSPCNGHYNARGYRLLAEVIAKEITVPRPLPPRAHDTP